MNARADHGAVRTRAEPDQVLFSRVGLTLPAGLTYAGWAKAGRQIAGIADSSAWCLGDWLVHGQQKYRDRGRYRHAITEAGLDYQTLRNYAWVARSFPLARRREGLSFQHHAEVAALTSEEQDHWLDEAEHHRWSRNQLRAALRQARTWDPRPPREVDLPRLTVSRGRIEWWQAAARRHGVDFEKWILLALDSAALAAGPEPGTAHQELDPA